MSEPNKRIRAEDVDLESLLSKKHYKIDYYQRDYAWESEEVKALLDDLTTKFKDSYTAGDKVINVANYDQYFLGSVVLNDKSGDFFIIDGQQRLTTLSLVFAAISNITDKRDVQIKDALDYVYSDNYGEAKFNILSESRIPIMEYIVGKKKNLNSLEKNSLLLKNYNLIVNYLNNNEILKNDEIILFYYWLHKKVLLVKIESNGDKESYNIFESMNDRGRPLTSLDMFKGYILSLAGEDRDEAVKTWNILQSKFETENELSRFLVELFRAKYAKDNPKDAYRDKVKKIDWEEIGKKYHKFIKENKDKDFVNIQEGKGISLFLKELIYYADYLTFLNDKKENKQFGYEGLYYLHQSKHTELNILFYGLVEPYDKEMETKTKIISKFLDIRSGLLSWNMKNAKNNFNNNEYFVSLMNKIRSQEETDSLILLHTFYKELTRERKITNGWNKIRKESAPFLNSSQNIKNNIFYILNRVTTFLQISSGQSDDFHVYYNDKYEIEHILAKDINMNPDIFASQDELDFFRNKIGALGILDRKTNASFQANDYSSKREKYTQHNRFLGILSDSMYSEDGSLANHPGLNTLIKNYPQLKGKIKPYKCFNQNSIAERNDLISEISNIIWNVDDLLEFADDDINSFEELGEYIYHNIDIKEVEEENLSQYSFPIGKTLIFKKEKSIIEFTYDGLEKVTIKKIINGKIYPNSEEKYANTNLENTFGIILKELIMIKDNEYNWEGSIHNLPMKSPIHLLSGRMSYGEETVKNDYRIKNPDD